MAEERERRRWRRRGSAAAMAEPGGKVVMVTGASSGLGRQICLDLAGAGCLIVAAARSRLAPPPARVAAPVELDLSADGSSIERSVQKAWEAFGRIDALVNNAGVRGAVRSPVDLPEEEWSSILATNLTGTWLVSKSVCRRMRDAGRKGSIISVSSISGLNRGQLPGGLHYSVSKAGVMALELGPHKIRVNSISPGLFRSEITAGLMEKEWLSTVAARTVPLGTFGSSDPALTSVVRYLIHDSSEYVTGNIFIVDAGATLPGIPIFSSL
ncbi:unnamed protein product [Spirodela intermedia]|uniref:Uncharacterized protein n=1 Tax=Spirodela intermedia TaxID=51605 RepID=A0A7I8JM54_SPIIN|nr:unnamed protein product [Spirodela intermedia]CAA6670895.1 unnamed protein product [Spirodela intermedia]